eukprot:TRINITY_DN11135_c0_g1_i1.p2 TRINITY_DN11135_c0_g1~~TRINITY_DN11135_c0_g1_i1.p2  ORF type:complete len:240 (+),score=17.30 TRINITY_DN11135_c0_g1_i1:196-915(+)
MCIRDRSTQSTWGRLISERYYSKGTLNGVAKTFTADGFFTSFAEYKDGKINGVKRIYYEDTPDKVMEEAHYKNDIKNGTSKWFTQESRLIAEYNYQDGLLEGELRTYYPSGKLMLLEHYILNKRQGEAIEYYETGKMKSKGVYEDDLKEGEWILFDENQNVSSKDKYKAGSLVKRQCKRKYKILFGATKAITVLVVRPITLTGCTWSLLKKPTKSFHIGIHHQIFRVGLMYYTEVFSLP